MFEKYRNVKKKNEKSKSRNFLTLCEKFHPKSKKKQKRRVQIPKTFDFLQKVSLEKSKKSKHRKLFDFLPFCEKFCDFRAVRLPVRGALRFFGGSTINGQFMGFLRETKHHGSPWGYTSIATQDCWMPLVNSHRHGNHHVFHRL